VIVPVYNVARWLPEALSSIDRQGCRADLEVVIIDDGSTDDSSRIAREYADKTPGTRYVRQDNAGLGAARNHGLRLATGDHLAFLDSDDLYPDGALDDLLRLAEEHDAPVVVGDMQGLPPRPSPPWRRELVTGDRVVTDLAQAPDLVGNPSACNKVFRRDFVTAQGATFSEGTAFEDVLFTLPLLLRAERIVLTPRLAYLYRTRGDGTSIMDARSKPEKIFQHLGIIERLADELDGASEGTRRAVQRWIAYMQLHYAWRAAGALDDDQLAEFTRRMSALFKDVPVEVASEFVTNLGAGLRAVGVYEQDAATVRDPRFAGPLLVRAGQVYAGHPHFERYRDLLRLRSLSGTFTRLTGGTTPVLGGTLHLPGITATAGEVRPDIVLEVGDSLVRRPVTVKAMTGNRMDWTCAVPLDAVGPGSHRLRLVIREDGREHTVPSGAGTRGSRAVAVGGGRTAWVLGSRSTPQLVVAGGPLASALQAPLWLAGAAYQKGRSAGGLGRRTLRTVARRVLRRR
jgi:hypothetical protein